PLKSKNPFKMASNIGRLAKIIRKHKIDIVHARSRAPAWSAYFAAARCRVPFVTTFHNAYGSASALKRKYNSVMGKGARVIAISDFVAGHAAETYGLDRASLHVVPRGVDIGAFDPATLDPQRVKTLRQTWNLTPGTPVILCPARITRWKGQSVLIAALAKLERRDFACVIVGGGKDSAYGKELERDIQRAGLSKNIAIFDTCRDMPAAYALADLVVTPSTRPEGFGRTVVEAQAMGAPVIATNHGGARETVIHGETGWLVEPDDAAELAEAINTVLNLSLEQRHALAQRAIAHVRAHFTTASMTAKTIAIYRDILAKVKTGASL
ncbi:MAG: glycosyltransferase family 4 protein, partial [Alphaproteobacteria bacterium]|nr:glycosyltransferase family 4 protein [Alphaproteobacteria bacterium]